MKTNKSVERLRKDFSLSNPSRIYDRNELNSLENLISTDREGIDSLIRNIDTKIEEIGKLCDKKKERTYEDYKNVLKHQKSHLNEDLAKLKIKLVETENMNTKDDMLNKIKKELRTIKNQVFEKDKELQANNLELYTVENKLNLLNEDKVFYDKEIKNAKKYNLYLKNKLKQMEEANSGNSGDENKAKNENSFYLTNHKFKTSFQKKNSMIRDEEIEKLDRFIRRNEQIINNKIKNEEKALKEKFGKLKSLEKFDNPILNILVSKQKEYESLLINSRTSNQEVFFNVPEHDLSGSNTVNKSRNIMKSKINSLFDSNLNKIDKKEIVKNFLEDEQVKKFIYDALYSR